MCNNINFKSIIDWIEIKLEIFKLEKVVDNWIIFAIVQESPQSECICKFMAVQLKSCRLGQRIGWNYFFDFRLENNILREEIEWIRIMVGLYISHKSNFVKNTYLFYWSWILQLHFGDRYIFNHCCSYQLHCSFSS